MYYRITVEVALKPNYLTPGHINVEQLKQIGVKYLKFMVHVAGIKLLILSQIF